LRQGHPLGTGMVAGQHQPAMILELARSMQSSSSLMMNFST
jgi:hypothetical protein